MTPDYVVPDGLLATGGGTAVNSPTNFAGKTASYPSEQADFNVQGLWWRSPAGSESGGG